uniref:Tenascin-like n=1 Tax=Crassostrea virginica TaxID=6565 RepID=A0A8B8BFT5_CRAVI|nr:tenascin-like [Crassostrea virginica]
MDHTPVNGQCLKSNLSLGQSCVHNTQCKGTENAERCLNGECFCEEGFVLQRLRCLLGNLTLGQTCKHDVQCTATENSGRCIDGKCFCAEGHVLQKMSCLPGKRATFISWITDHGVLLMTGSGVICMIVICSAILLVLNRRKSGKMRSPPTTQHSLAERSGFQNIPNESLTKAKEEEQTV